MDIASNSKKWHCEHCDKSYFIYSKNRHMKTKKHMKNEANYMDIASNNSSVKKDPSRGIR